MDKWRHVKSIEQLADIGTRGMSIEGRKESVWLKRLAWLQTDEEKRPLSWCIVNEVEAEQATSFVATETKLNQPFDWRQCSSSTEYDAYCMRFKGKQKRPPKQKRSTKLSIFFPLFQTESFPNVSKWKTNKKEIYKTLNVPKLSPFIKGDGTIRKKGRRKLSNLDYNVKHPIILRAKHPIVQFLLEGVHCDNLQEVARYVKNIIQQEY